MKQNKTLRIFSGLLALVFIFQSVTISLAQVVEIEMPVVVLSDSTTVNANEAEATVEAISTLEPTDTAISLDQQKQLELGSLIAPAMAPDTVFEVEIDNTISSVDDKFLMQSAHPYKGNSKTVLKIHLEGASQLSVRFSASFALENGYDTVGLYSPSETEGVYRLRDGKTYTGTDLANETKHVEGDTLVIRFESDESIEAYGWDIAEIVPTYPEPTLVPTVEEPVVTEDVAEEPSSTEETLTETLGTTDELIAAETPVDAIEILTITPSGIEEKPAFIGITSGEGAMGYFIVDPNLLAPLPTGGDSGKPRAIPAPTINKITKATYNNKDCLHITWSAELNATGYRLWVSTKSPDYGFTEIYDISNYTGIYYYPTNPNQTYYFRLATIVNGVYGNLSGAAGGRLNIGTPPSLLLTQKPDNSRHFLSWTAVSGATSYILLVSETLSDSGFSEIWQGSLTSCSIPVPDSTKTYYYKVVPYFYTMEGPMSSVVTALPSAPMEAPSLTVSKASSDHFKLTWNKIPGATGYRIWRSETSASSGYNWVANVGNLSAVITKAPSATKTYYYRVAAMRDGVFGQLCAAVAARITIDQTILTVTKVGEKKFSLDWNGIPGVTGYRIWRSETGANSGYTWVKNVPAATTTIETDVPLSTKTYYYRVAAIVGTIVGPLSAAVSTPK